MIKIALLGLGTVGTGVWNIINTRTAADAAATQVKYVLVRRDRSDVLPEGVGVREIETIASDPEISIVVEAMGGVSPAFKYVDMCLRAGKHVVTANKELIATYGAALQQTAREHGAGLMFEAAVGGGIPVISGLCSVLHGSRVNEITGILNGTGNYILCAMERGEAYADALAFAQAAGFAELDPTDDVQGIDTLRKICILAGIASHSSVLPSQHQAHGITEIIPREISLLRGADMRVKLLGRAVLDSSGCEITVMPAAVKTDGFFGVVNGADNAVLVKGDNCGPMGFCGAGAGRYPTAGAVCADIAALARCGRDAECAYFGRKTAVPITREHSFYIAADETLSLEAFGCAAKFGGGGLKLWRTPSLSPTALEAFRRRVSSPEGGAFVGTPMMITEEQHD